MAAAIAAIRNKKRKQAREDGDDAGGPAFAQPEPAKTSTTALHASSAEKEITYSNKHCGRNPPGQDFAFKAYYSPWCTWGVAGVIVSALPLDILHAHAHAGARPRTALVCITRCGGHPLSHSQIFNFLAIVAETEIDPFPCPDKPTQLDPCLQRYRPIWSALDDICNVIFILELGLHYYGDGCARRTQPWSACAHAPPTSQSN